MRTVPLRQSIVKWREQPDWTRMRTRWHVFQGVRSILLLAAFILLAIAHRRLTTD